MFETTVLTLGPFVEVGHFRKPTVFVDEVVLEAFVKTHIKNFCEVKICRMIQNSTWNANVPFPK